VSPPAFGARPRVLLIVNPHASRAARIRAAAERAFEAANVDVDVKETTKVGDSGRIAHAHSRAGYRHVFVCGGDGTVVEAIAALADNPNARAVRALLHGRTATIDLGRLENGTHFAIGLGVGLDEAMIAGATSALKKRYGIFAYAYAALRAGVRLEKFDARVTVDGKVINCRASAILVANLGTVVNGLISFGKGIVHDDGLLHVCIYSPDNFLDAMRIFTRMVRNTAHLDRQVTVIEARELLLETIPARGVQADGELLGPTPVKISVRPNAGRILIPA
jgi:diacylglycerol kinase family enzyme